MFNLLADPSKARGISAGTQPGERVHPECVAAMNELGIDMTNEKPKLLTPELASTANSLITMGCGEACPYVLAS
jgi:arsenate reductase